MALPVCNLTSASFHHYSCHHSWRPQYPLSWSISHLLWSFTIAPPVCLSHPLLGTGSRPSCQLIHELQFWSGSLTDNPTEFAQGVEKKKRIKNVPNDFDLKMGRNKLKLTEVRKTIKESGRVFFFGREMWESHLNLNQFEIGVTDL